MTQFARYAEMREGILHPRRGCSRTTWPFGMTLAEQRETVLNLINTVMLLERQVEAGRWARAETP